MVHFGYFEAFCRIQGQWIDFRDFGAGEGSEIFILDQFVQVYSRSM
jgi:hypothetical protein